MNTPRGRLERLHGSHHAIAKGMLSVGLFVVLGKLAGAFKEAAVAYRFGVGSAVDAYIFVMNIVTWPVTVWFSVLTVVLIPLAARIRHDMPQALPRFRAELLGAAILLGLVLTTTVWLGLPLLLREQWLGLSPDTARLAKAFTAPLATVAFVGVIIALLSAWMMVAQRHVNTLMEGIPALTIGIAVLMVGQGSLEVLVWGTVLGFALHAGALAVPLARHGEFERPQFSRNSDQWLPFWRAFGILLVGQAMMNSLAVVDQVFAARIGTGSISTLSYANRVVALLVGVGATAVSRAALPVFSQGRFPSAAAGLRIAGQWAVALFVLGLLAAVVAWWSAPWAIRLLFERGAFTAENGSAVTAVLRYALVQLPFFFASMVLVAYASSQRLYRLLFVTGVSALLCKICGNLLLIPLFGVSGIAMAWGVVYGVNSLILWNGMRRLR